MGIYLTTEDTEDTEVFYLFLFILCALCVLCGENPCRNKLKLKKQ